MKSSIFLLVILVSSVSAKTITHPNEAYDCIVQVEKLGAKERELDKTRVQLVDDQYMFEIKLNELRMMRDEVRIVESAIRSMAASSKELTDAAELRKTYKKVALSMRDEQYLLDKRVTVYDRDLKQFEIDQEDVHENCYGVEVGSTVLSNACFDQKSEWCDSFRHGPVNTEDSEGNDERHDDKKTPQ